MAPIVTVAIPTRNRPHLLREAIASVLRQSWQDFEIFVSDNSASSDTVELLESFGDPRIRHRRYDRPMSMAANWRSSFLTPTTKYLAMMQDDDYWGPEHLRNAIECLEAEPRAACYSCAMQHVESGRVTEVQTVPGYEWLDRPHAFQPAETLRIAFRRHSMQLSSVVLRRDALDGINWGPRNSYFPVDMQIIVMAALKGLWIYDPRPDTYSRHHARSVSNSTFRLRPRFFVQADHVMRTLALEAMRRGCFEEETFLDDMRGWPVSQRGGIAAAFLAPYAPRPLRSFARKMIERYPEILSSPDTSTHCRIARHLGSWYLVLADPLNRLRAGWWPIGARA